MYFTASAAQGKEDQEYSFLTKKLKGSRAKRFIGVSLKRLRSKKRSQAGIMGLALILWFAMPLERKP